MRGVSRQHDRLPVTAILLAAGAARRFGTQKLLAQLADGRHVIEAAVMPLLEQLQSVIAVVRDGQQELAALLTERGCRVVVNPRADEGMGTSIAAGVAAARDLDRGAGWLIALGDMPHVRGATVRAIAQGLCDTGRIVVPVQNGMRGHPVAFPVELGAALVMLQGDRGARAVVEANTARLELLNVDDPGVLADVDVPADLHR